jgi:hypothetical protein
MNNNENVQSSVSQNKMILAYLKEGHSITPLEALKRFGCLRLGARIFDLKEQGYNIKTDRITTNAGKRVASYKLIED